MQPNFFGVKQNAFLQVDKWKEPLPPSWDKLGETGLEIGISGF